MVIRPATSARDIQVVRELFLEYARSLNFSLCFQGFDRELAELPGDYTAPAGCLLLAEVHAVSAGCVALRRLAEDVGEMKRMYLKPEFRGAGGGRRLAEAVIAAARQRGYRRLRLDTVPAMAAALQLYQSLGFAPIDAYRTNPVPGALFLELCL
jgi:putative acetyltransferase